MIRATVPALLALPSCGWTRRRTANVGTLILALANAINSYDALAAPTRDDGLPWVLSWLFPLATDGIIAVATPAQLELASAWHRWRRSAGPAWWLGVVMVAGGGLLFEHEAVSGLRPALMHGHSVSDALTAASLIAGLPVKREIAIEVPAPAEDTTWWPVQAPTPPASPGRRPAPDPAPVEVGR